MHRRSRTLSPESLGQVISLALPKRINTGKTRNVEFPTTGLCLQVANELSFVVSEEVQGSHCRMFVVRSSDRHLRDCAIEVQPPLQLSWELGAGKPRGGGACLFIVIFRLAGAPSLSRLQLHPRMWRCEQSRPAAQPPSLTESQPSSRLGRKRIAYWSHIMRSTSSWNMVLLERQIRQRVAQTVTVLRPSKCLATSVRTLQNTCPQPSATLSSEVPVFSFLCTCPNPPRYRPGSPDKSLAIRPSNLLRL